MLRTLAAVLLATLSTAGLLAVIVLVRMTLLLYAEHASHSSMGSLTGGLSERGFLVFVFIGLASFIPFLLLFWEMLRRWSLER